MLDQGRADFVLEVSLAYKNILLPDTYAQEEVKQRGSILQKLLQRTDFVQLI